MRKVAVLTSGGDAPGMNSALFIFSSLAKKNKCEVIFVEDGYQGLIENKYLKLDPEQIKRSVYSAGTVIGSSRSLEFKNSSEVRKKCAASLKKKGVEALVVLGGNGSYEGAILLSKLGLPVILVPATIDNDVYSSDYTIGFFSALEEIGGAIKKVWDSANSHSQLTFIEVMGRDCSDLAVISSCASPLVDLVITQDKVPTLADLKKQLLKLKKLGRKGMVVVIAEKILGQKVLPSMIELTQILEKSLGFTVRGCVLGHTQRGATPTTWELYLSSMFGKEAFEAFSEKEFNIAIGFNGIKFVRTPISKLKSSSKSSQLKLMQYKNTLAF